MLVVAAVCPHPPLLVPQVAAGAAPELRRLREACGGAAAATVAGGVDLVAVVGSGPRTTEHVAGDAGSLSAYGVPVRVALGTDRGAAPTLPLALTIGAWLLDETEYAGPVVGLSVAAGTAPADCAALGQRLAARAGRVGLLVMGDASARRSTAAPGYLDDRAAGFDESVAKALAAADCAALLDLDPALAAELLAAGRAPWQVLAGAADGGEWRAQLHHDDAPYGVGYLVATWGRA